MDRPGKLASTLNKNLFLWYLPAIFLIIHGWMSWTQNELWGNVMAPIALFAASFSLIPFITRKVITYLTVLFFALGIFVFGLAETIWAILDIFGYQDPSENVFLLYLYAVPNLCFVLAVISFLLVNLKRWHPVQLGLDLFAVSSVMVGAVYFVFFKGHIAMDSENLSALLYLVLDTLGMSILITIFTSSRSSKTGLGHKIIFLAMLAYTFADGLYINQVFNNQYVPYGLTDWLYIASLLITASGVKVAYQELISGPENPEATMLVNVGSIWNSWWILIIPILTFILRGARLVNVAYFALILIFYLLASLYVQNHIATENLLKERTANNEALQDRVNERTSELQAINRELEHIIQYDSLTGLHSRSRFLDMIDQTLLYRDPSQPVYMALIDIDRFKMINDLYSQDIGDKALQQIAGRIRGLCDEHVEAARLGGDEFAFLFIGYPAFDSVQAKLDALFSLFQKPLLISPFQIPVKIHVGVASYPENAHDRTGLLKCAKTAVEQAKSKKLLTYSVYDKSIHEQVRRRHEIGIALQKADLEREFSLVYQPIYDTSGQDLLGMEALLRWDSSILGMISPFEFIPAAEETGMILALGEWVMTTAMRQIAQWNAENKTDYRISINISAIQLESMTFIERVQSLILETQVNPAWLNFEITESIAMKSQDIFVPVLEKLAVLGISVAMDDFGTGYSSYGYLKSYSINYLKIDKQLIDSITTRPDDALIVRAIVAMADALQIKTIAEGVE